MQKGQLQKQCHLPAAVKNWVMLQKEIVRLCIKLSSISQSRGVLSGSQGRPYAAVTRGRFWKMLRMDHLVLLKEDRNTLCGECSTVRLSKSLPADSAYFLQILIGGGQEASQVTTTSSRAGRFESRFFHKVRLTMHQTAYSRMAVAQSNMPRCTFADTQLPPKTLNCIALRHEGSSNSGILLPFPGWLLHDRLCQYAPFRR